MNIFEYAKMKKVLGGGGGSGGGGVVLNIAYGDTAPEDTSKLWVKTAKPSAVKVASKLEKASTNIASVTDTGIGMAASTSHVTPVFVNECFYVFGGYSNSSYRSTIKKIDVQTGVETTISSSLPLPIADAGTCLYEGNIYVFGGRSGRDNSVLTAIYRYSPETETLTTLTATIPDGLYKSTVCVNGTKAYIFGGYYGTFSEYTPSTTIWCYDFETDTISALSISMEGMFQPGLFSYGQYIYMFGGYIGSETNRTDAIRIFDCVNQTIRTISAKLPTTANLVKVSSLEDTVYVIYRNYVSLFDLVSETVTVLLQSNEISSGICAEWNDGLSIGSVSDIKFFSPGVSILLPSNVLQIHSNLNRNIFNLINTDTAQVEIGVNAVYKGNADDIGEQVSAALHNGTEWVNI